MFTESEYERLHSLVFRSDYIGYKPSVIEIPNGDGKADVDKRYAHVAMKYMTTDQQREDLMPFLERAHNLSMQVAYRIIGFPSQYYPDIRYGALRVLDYPPGSVSNRHEDFDLFTLMMYRDQPDQFVSYGDTPPALHVAYQLNPQAHLGQLGAAIGLGEATPHEVLPSPTRQRSIVYFSIPDHDAVLPSGVTVRDWLNERMARSRTEFKAYQ